MANYEVWYADDLGNPITRIKDIISLDYTLVLGDIGVAIIYVPYDRTAPYSKRIPDRRIHIYRQVGLVGYRLEFSGYLRKFDLITTLQGHTASVLYAYDANSLLARRIVPYYAGTANTAYVNVYADNAMKAIFTDNFISNADYSGTPSPSRSIPGVSVDSNFSNGPIITKEFAWQNVLKIFQDIQAESRANGNEVFFGLVATGETSLKFRTWTGQPGTVRSTVFSIENGNLFLPQLIYDYTFEANYIYAGGAGEDDEQIIVTSGDTARINVSRVGRTEAFAQSSGETPANVQEDADTMLERSRRKVSFFGDIIETQSTQYGVDWGFGDRVQVSYGGLQMNTIIRAVNVKMDSSGSETIRSKVESTYVY